MWARSEGGEAGTVGIDACAESGDGGRVSEAVRVLTGRHVTRPLHGCCVIVPCPLHTNLCHVPALCSTRGLGGARAVRGRRGRAAMKGLR